MMIRLLSTQIPQYWEIIKFTIANVDDVKKQNLMAYLNSILHDLLSDKAQCFFRLNPETREIFTVVITRIDEDKISGDKTFVMQSVYSFRVADLSTREMERDFLKDFAIERGCSCIVFKSPHKIAWELGEAVGFKEIHRTYMYRL